MAQATLRRLLLCLLALVVSGCAADLAGNPGFGGLPPDVWDEDLLTHRELFTRPIVQACLRQSRNSAERRDCRDRITFARMRYSDLVFERYRHRLFYGASGTNAAVDIAVLGLNTAGALGTASKLLAGVSAGLVGTRAIVEKEILQNATIPTLILKMEEQRAAVRNRIEDRLRRDESVYSFETAEIDAGDYFRAGTLHNALIALQGDSAYGLTYQKARLDQPLTAPAPWPVALAVPAPALVPPLPSPPPISPGIVGPVPPPPLPGAPAPALVTQPMSDEPAVARMKLREALGQGVDGKGHRDPARVTLMRKCASNLGIVVPRQISLWMDGANAKTLTDVTDCIHRQAAATQGGRR
jgi:hypothetical protein